jgi:hypothetical protein
MAYAVCDRCKSALLGESRTGERRPCPYCGHPVRSVTSAEFASTYRTQRGSDRKNGVKGIKKR